MTPKGADEFTCLDVEDVDNTCCGKYEEWFEGQFLSHSPCKTANVGFILLEMRSIQVDIFCKTAHVRKFDGNQPRQVRKAIDNKSARRTHCASTRPLENHSLP
jgi:hypothetical protein